MKLKLILTLAFLILIMTIAPLAINCSATTTENTGDALVQTFQDVSPQEAASIIQENLNNPDFVILDVRTPGEYSAGHLENAINIDFYSKNFNNDLSQLDKDKTYVLHCKSGGRSGNTVDIMRVLDFTEVYHLSTGIDGWNAAQLPTVKGP